MNHPELAEDPRFDTNAKRCVHHYTDLKPIITEWAKNYTVDELETMIVEAGIPFSRIYNIEQVCQSDVIRDRNMLWTVHDTGIGEDVQVPGTPIKMHGCADVPERPAPVAGEHTDAILKNLLHMPDEKLSVLRESGVI